MRLTLKDDLPFVRVTIVFRGIELTIPDVLVDTGSATTILSADQLLQIGIVPEPSDTLYTIRSVGGIETVFTRQIEQLRIGQSQVTDIEIEVGGMDYGFEIQGILGMDFLSRAGAIINLRAFVLEFSWFTPCALRFARFSSTTSAHKTTARALATISTPDDLARGTILLPGILPSHVSGAGDRVGR